MHGNEAVTTAKTVAIPEIPKPKVGDYVDYEPDKLSDDYRYTVYGKYSGYGTYTSHVLTTPTDQEIGQDTLKWQILKIYDDESMDLIGTVTSKDIYFQGALGYNNGVFLLNDICKTLYSKTLSDGRKIEARSVSLKDFEDEENGGNWKAKRDTYVSTNGKIQYGHTKTYTGTKSYYPSLYAREIGAGINKEIVNETGIKQWDKEYTSPTTETYGPTETTGTDNQLTVTQTCYGMSMSEETHGKAYGVLFKSGIWWIASRGVDCSTDYAGFRLFYGNGSMFNTSDMFQSNSTERYRSAKFRPVVHLGSNVELELSSKATNATTPHKITKY